MVKNEDPRGTETGDKTYDTRTDKSIAPILVNRAAKRAFHSVMSHGGSEVDAMKAARATLPRR